MPKLERTEVERLNRYLRSIYSDIREDDLIHAKEEIQRLSESVDQLIEQHEQQGEDQNQT